MPISYQALETLQRAVDEAGHTVIVTCAEGCKHYLYPAKRNVLGQVLPVVNEPAKFAKSDMSDEGDPGFSRIKNADIAEGFASPRGPADVDDGNPFPYSDFGG